MIEDPVSVDELSKALGTLVRFQSQRGETITRFNIRTNGALVLVISDPDDAAKLGDMVDDLIDRAAEAPPPPDQLN